MYIYTHMTTRRVHEAQSRRCALQTTAQRTNEHTNRTQQCALTQQSAHSCALITRRTHIKMTRVCPCDL